jgi:endonuclease-3 related protein
MMIRGKGHLAFQLVDPGSIRKALSQYEIFIFEPAETGLMENQPRRESIGARTGGVSDLLQEVYERLLAHHGPQHWWPADTPFEIIIGAILVQAVAWPNAAKAISNLKAAQALEPAVLHALPTDELARLIRPAGYYNVKARKIKAIIAHLYEHYQYDLDALLSKETRTLRRELLSIYGIGPETAGSIILYAAGQPVFVVDAYTRRLLSRLGLVSDDIDYDELQVTFEHNLPHQVSLYQEYHALIVQHGKSICRKRPLCSSCPILSLCGYGQSQTEVL